MGHQCGKYAQQYDTSMCDWKECYNDVKRFWMIQRGPEDLVQKNTNVYGILWKYFLWFIVISCDFLWFLDIYCDLVWFHENSWVYSSLHVNFDNRNITSQKNWVWCVSTNLKMAKKNIFNCDACDKPSNSMRGYHIFRQTHLDAESWS